ncbi:Rsc58 protein [Saccharomycopsis crataegensis]|uniref:Rsc58 protein n=1 Tax=Saccharomycopsis crataegensis TaxID=43959 RepID=A0AAV5QVJ9_9ASCO|nr:Rsc58 protein [Saccharomycopsis crataegensis]
MPSKDGYLKESLQQIYTVLQHGDTKSNILNTGFYKDFFEESPTKITGSYLDYEESHNESNKEEAGDNNNDDTLKVTINDRFQSGYYTSIYKLYHDIKVSASVLISNNKLGTEQYLDVDNYYKFATEFLLTEAGRLQLDLQEFKKSLLNIESHQELSEFSDSLAHDFDRISTSFRHANNESLFIVTGQTNNLPLFSSAGQKSELDLNEYPIPEPFRSMKVLPHCVATPGSSLGFLSSSNVESKVPNPTLPPTEITRDIFHPNWHAIPCVPWLEFKSSNSFIPLIDETISALNSRNKGKIYFEQIGLPKLIKLRDDYYKNIEKEKIESESDKKVINADEDKENEEEKKSEDEKKDEKMQDDNEPSENGEQKKDDEQVDEQEPNGEQKVTEKKEMDEQKPDGDIKPEEESDKTSTSIVGPGILDINVKSILEWKPGQKFEDDEINALENGKEQKYVSKLLFDLNKLRSERFVAQRTSKVTKPTNKEREIYFKVKRLLQAMVQNLKPSDLVDTNEEESEEDKGLRLSSNIPALRMNYPGTLHAPLPVQYNAARYTSRLQSLGTRAYKKRR